jgi:hypothetical protein
MASVYNEYAMKSQYDTSIYLQVAWVILFTFGLEGPFRFDPGHPACSRQELKVLDSGCLGQG